MNESTSIDTLICKQTYTNQCLTNTFKPMFNQCFICKLENEKFQSLIYFLHRLFYTAIFKIRPCIMGECLEGTLLLDCSMH